MRVFLRRLGWAATFATMSLAGCQCDDELAQLNGALLLEPPVLDFGRVPVGGEKKLMLTMRNKGEFRLTITGYETALPFVGPTGTATIGTGKTKEIEVAFRSPSIGPHTGVLTITSDDPKVPSVDVPLSGEGIQAAVLVDPLEIDWGEVLWTTQTTRESRTVTITNPGTDSFELTELTLTDPQGGAFELDVGDAIKTYGPGQSETFTVSYLPKAMGPVASSVSIKTTAPLGGEVVVSLRARAVGPILEVCAGPDNGTEACASTGAPRLDFGLVALAQRTTGHVRVMNLGDRELVANASLPTPDPELSFAPDPTTLGMFSVAPGGEQRFDVAYLPADYGFDSINLIIGSNSAVRPSSVVRIDGRAPRAVASSIPGTATFTLSGGANHSQLTIKLTNCGELALVLSQNVALTNPTGPGAAFTLANAPTAGTTIQPGPCQNPDAVGVDFTLNFDPPANGIYGGVIEVHSNDEMTPIYRINVSGDKRP
jgi:hypothetical protein